MGLKRAKTTFIHPMLARAAAPEATIITPKIVRRSTPAPTFSTPTIEPRARTESNVVSGYAAAKEAMQRREAGAATRLWKRIHAEGISPNSEAIARIWADEDVAVLFFEVGEGGAPAEQRALSEAGARMMGWRGGRSEVCRMTRDRAEAFADSLSRTFAGDIATVSWLRRLSGNRLFACVHVGTLCFDFVQGEGFAIVPGTLDEEWMS